MLVSVLPSFIFKLPDWLFVLIQRRFLSYSDRATLDLLLWEGGVSTLNEGLEMLKRYTNEGLEGRIECPTLALAAQGEGREFDKQAKGFMQKIGSKDGHEALIVSAGTATSTRGRGDANSFNLLKLQKHCAEVERFEWRPTEKRFTTTAYSTFLRQLNGWMPAAPWG